MVGGYVHRGRAIPGLVGRYLYADFCSSRIWSFARDGARVTGTLELIDDPDPTHVLGDVTSFGEDAAGELYVVVDGVDGLVFRIDPE